jgi:hypothetical protein
VVNLQETTSLLGAHQPNGDGHSGGCVSWLLFRDRGCDPYEFVLRLGLAFMTLPYAAFSFRFAAQYFVIRTLTAFRAAADIRRLRRMGDLTASVGEPRRCAWPP